MGKPVEGDPSKSTRWAWAKQTPDGVLSSGNLSADKVKHAWQLMNGNDSRHRITMDKDGARLFQDGDRASLRREVEASILQEIQLAMINAGADKEVKEAKADLKS